MTHTLKSRIALVTLAALFVGLLPATAFAADGERVLSSIRHSSATAAVNVANTTSATLTVPFSHSSTVNLAQGLDISYSTSVYASASPSFPDGSTAEVGGSAVNMVVTYQRHGDQTFYKTSYTILVVRADYLASKFSGTITKSASPTKTVTFAEADFLDKYTKNDGTALGSIVITGSNPSFGTLRVGSAVYNPGDAINISSIRSGYLTFVATSAGTVDYLVEAYGSDAEKTKAEGSVLLKITAVSVSPTFSGTISKTVTLPQTLTLSPSDFTGLYTRNDGGALASVTISGSNPSFGKLMLGGNDYSSGTSISLSDISNGRLTFVPTGTGTVSYTLRAYASGDTSSAVGTATLSIAVQTSAAADISYTVGTNTRLALSVSDLNSVCVNLTGSNLHYMVFTLPSSSYGRLYYDYTSPSSYGSMVSSGTVYYRNSAPYISSISFVPTSGYSGTVALTYTGYSTAGYSFTGRVIVNIQATADDITYSTSENVPVTLVASDFTRVCNSATNGTLSYVRFTLPPSTYGSLNYDYSSPSSAGSSVSTGTNYYRDVYPYLARVTFVPRSGYTGTVPISYTGYNTNGGLYTGSIKVIVREGDGSSLYFNDVGANYSWASTAIDYLYRTGVVTGVGSGMYNPAANISRGHFMLMLRRAFNLNATTSGNFSDVPVGSEYYEAIAIAKAFGIAAGYEGKFRPTEAISRQDAMVLISRTLAVASVNIPVGSMSDLTRFSDYGEVADYAVPAASALVKANVITGTSGRLNPKSNVTRAEMAVILYRVLTLQ